ncbi:MAG: FtsX-like permease family protein, partial [Acidobacteriota bacterium]
MTARTLWRQLRRESRGSRSRLIFFVVCLAVGVGAVVSVASLSDALDQGIRLEARGLLAADVVARSRAPLDDALRDAIDEIAGSARTEVLEMPTVVATPPDPNTGAVGPSRLVELKAIGGEYPYYGELELDPPRPLGELLTESTAVVGPEVLRRLGVAHGDTLRIGGAEFTIAGTVEHEPDRVVSAFNLGPRVFLSTDGLERADLERYGSRITYRLLARLPEMDDESLAALVETFEETVSDPSVVRFETWREAQPALRRGLERTERYLGLAALLSLLVGGVGVAQTVRSWLAGRLDAIAVYRCLGYRPRDIAWLYLGQTTLLGLGASLLGVGLGVALLAVPTATLGGILPVEDIDPIQPWAWLRGLVLGTGVALLFAIPPIAEARRVPPIRVLRRSAEPLPASRLARFGSGAILILTVFVLAATQTRSALEGGLFAGGLVVLAGLLTLAARGLMRLATRPRRRARLWLRQGLAALARPGAGTVGAVVALGLGVLVVLAMFLVERGLTSELRRELPANSPSAFFIDIQPDQWDGVRQTIEGLGAQEVGRAQRLRRANALYEPERSAAEVA